MANSAEQQRWTERDLSGQHPAAITSPLSSLSCSRREHPLTLYTTWLPRPVHGAGWAREQAREREGVLLSWSQSGVTLWRHTESCRNISVMLQTCCRESHH
ncbi:hypothetical protein AGIG_G15726 [Arapaima gigas]